MNIEKVTDEHRSFDTTSIGVKLDSLGEKDEPEIIHESDSDSEHTNDNPDNAECTPVRLLPFEVFRKRLVEHFDILFQKGKLQWPSRTGIGTQPVVEYPKGWGNV